MTAVDQAEQIEVGKVVGVHGLQGWLKLHSYCDPREQIFSYRPLLIGSQRIEDYDGKAQGKGLLLKPAGANDRTSVEALIGCAVTIGRDQLPPVASGQYYWRDLVGLTVRNGDDELLGRVVQLMPTGANDVLVVQGTTKILIPFVPDVYVEQVDIEAGMIRVDWAADWV